GRLLPPGWRSKGNRSASSGAYRAPVRSAGAAAYGRAATTRSWARFSFDVATSSIVFVILRVLWTDLMRRRSSRGLAISARRAACTPPPRRAAGRRGRRPAPGGSGFPHRRRDAGPPRSRGPLAPTPRPRRRDAARAPGGGVLGRRVQGGAALGRRLGR